MRCEESMVESIEQIVNCSGMKFVVYLRVGPPSLDVETVVTRLYQFKLVYLVSQIFLVIIL